MEVPSWFGADEYYWLLRTVWFVVVMYLLIVIVKVSKGIKIPNRIKNWWKKRKDKHEGDIFSDY